MTRLEWSIAWRYLRSRRESALLSFISMIAIGGVIVGVSALIVIIGVMNGLQTDLRDKILLGSPDVRVMEYGETVRLSNWQGALDTIRTQPGVVAAAPFVLTAAMAANPASYVHGVTVQGIPAVAPADARVTDIRSKIVEGSFDFIAPDGSRNGAVLGDVLAQRLLLRVGDTVTLVSPSGIRVESFLMGIQPRVETYTVTGIFRTEMYEYDHSYVYLDLDEARALAGLGADVSGIEVRTANRNDAARVAAQLEAVLGFPRRTEDWTSQNSSLFRALQLEKFAMAVILLLIIVVAAFNIVSTLTMVVRAKTREIGILKTMGLRAASVRNVFLLQGTVIGVIGTSIGLALGLGIGIAIERYRLIPLSPDVYFIDHLPVRIQPIDTVLIVLASVVIATLATLYPARQAARLLPVKAIREE
jgi:lipoprotein-releasing system permease protein